MPPGKQCRPGSAAGTALQNEAELTGQGNGLGAVGRAELAQQVADVLFTVSRLTTNSPAMRGFGAPAASSARDSSSRGQLLHQAGTPRRRLAGGPPWYAVGRTPAATGQGSRA